MKIVMWTKQCPSNVIFVRESMPGIEACRTPCRLCQTHENVKVGDENFCSMRCALQHTSVYQCLKM